MIVWTFSILIAAMIGSFVLVERMNRRAMHARRRLFGSRPCLSRQEWCQTNATPLNLRQPNLAWTIAEFCAKSFGCDPSQFRPSDAFEAEFRFHGSTFLGLGLDDDLDDLEDALMEMLGHHRYGIVTAAHPRTLGDLIRQIDRVYGFAEALPQA